jgi:hypothetical protein
MYPSDLRSRLEVEDEVAVLPVHSESPADVIKLERVVHVGHIFIRTIDQRMYAAVDGVNMGGQGHLRIEPVTEEHRAAIRGQWKFPRFRVFG